MESHHSTTLCLLIFLMFSFADSDLSKDRDECATQLVGLATCLPYVSGSAKAPTLDCCTGLKQVLGGKSSKCLCVLVKDRNDPQLGIKINATLALSLPSACHAPSNASECLAMLGLSPNSPEAQVFEQFANSTKGSTAAASNGKGTATSSSPNEKETSDAISNTKSWLGLKLAAGVVLCYFTSILRV